MSSSGLVFDKYEIQHRLAIGGMGEVFYAMQRGVSGFERPVILKSLLPDLAEQKDFVDQFLDEARVAATLNHPNVVSIFEVGLWNGTYFIAMEYIRGRNLAQLLARCKEQEILISPLISARVIADAALGLEHAHSATSNAGEPLNIVHRDVSPQNIMLRDDGVTKVVDFGIARASNRASSRTATGTVKGKLAYMPPEQIGGEQLNAAADQYALGVCLWELLTQRRLFKGESGLEILQKVLAGQVQAPSELREGLDPMLDRIVMRMLASEASARFASCAEVSAVLNEYVSSHSTGSGQRPAELMRRLGTTDVSIQRRATPHKSQNFIISLESPQAQPVDEAAFPPVATREGEDSTRSSVLPASVSEVSGVEGVQPGGAPRASRRGVFGLVALALLVLVGGAVAWFITHAKAELPVAVVSPVRQPEPDPSPQVDASVAATEETPTQQPLPGRLRILTTPDGAAVRVDGRPEGKSPLVVEVSPGTHFVSVEKAGFRRIEREVLVPEGQQGDLDLGLVAIPASKPVEVQPSAPSAPGFLSLDTRPWSKVSIDGEPAGSTPLFKRRLGPGRHTLTLVNEGASIHTTKVVEIESGKTAKLSIPLTP